MAKTIIPKTPDETKKYITQMMKSSEISIKQMCEMLEKKYSNKTSTQNFSNKLSRGTFRDYEIAQIADICGHELMLVPKSEYIEDPIASPNNANTEEDDSGEQSFIAEVVNLLKKSDRCLEFFKLIFNFIHSDDIIIKNVSQHHFAEHDFNINNCDNIDSLWLDLNRGTYKTDIQLNFDELFTEDILLMKTQNLLRDIKVDVTGKVTYNRAKLFKLLGNIMEDSSKSDKPSTDYISEIPKR